MRTTGWLLMVVLAALASAGGSYWLGTRDGKAAQQAEQDRQAVAELNTILTQHKDQIDQANAASKAMREAATLLETENDKTTKELHHALQATAHARLGCEFDVGVLRHLSDARDRAAASAARGVRGALPQPAAGAGQP